MSSGAGGPRARMWDKGEKSGREQPMVPKAEFGSYYGRPVIKGPVWKWDIPAYFFTGGTMAGSSLLAAGGDLTGNHRLRRAGRLAAALNLAASTYFLIHDLGRPERFLNMMRVFKPTSPMSVGTWLLALYGAPTGLAAAAELSGRLPRLGRAAGLAAAFPAPVIATYTAVITSDTAIPSWHDAYRQLPFVFGGSAAASAGGLAMALVPPADAGPARRLGALGAALELLASEQMVRSIGMAAEPYNSGLAGKLHRWARRLTVAGALAGLTLGHRSRPAAVAAGAALLAGSGCTRFAVFHAGRQSAADPKYTVVPQRRRLEERSSRPQE